MRTVVLHGLLALAWTTVVAGEISGSPSPVVKDVLKLHQAKVDESVIVAFIQNSPQATLSATEIIDLRSQGVSSGILLTLLNPGNTGSAAPHPSAPAPVEPATSGVSTVTAAAQPAASAWVAPGTIEYVGVSTPTYIDVGSSIYAPYHYPYYPYDDWHIGVSIGLGWGWGYWGYPWYGYGCGYPSWGWYGGDHGNCDSHDGHPPPAHPPGGAPPPGGTGTPPPGGTGGPPPDGTLPPTGRPSLGLMAGGAGSSPAVGAPSAPTGRQAPGSSSISSGPGRSPTSLNRQETRPTSAWAGATKTGNIPAGGPPSGYRSVWSGGASPSSTPNPVARPTLGAASGRTAPNASNAVRPSYSAARSTFNPSMGSRGYGTIGSSGYSGVRSASARGVGSSPMGSYSAPRSYSGGASLGGFSGSRGSAGGGFGSSSRGSYGGGGGIGAGRGGGHR